MPKAKKKKILFAEDEKSLNKAFCIGLSKSNFQVIPVFDGEECIAKAKEEKPDIILLDLLMPKMDGETALLRLKEDKDTKNIPVVILTNFSNPEKFKDTLSKGAVDYLVKSNSSIEEVVAKVNEVLGK